MTEQSTNSPLWLAQFMATHGIILWGVADLRNHSTPRDKKGRHFPLALSWAIPMDPRVMAGIRKGPNHVYADAYAMMNIRINAVAVELSAEIAEKGFQSRPLAASDRTDPVTIKGDFPHKTAATRAGLGWIGRHCQLITRPFGSWVRLGTVFTDMPLACGPATERSFCGRCLNCVEACPAGALKGNAWYPGLPRDQILDVRKCDEYKKEHYLHYHNGHVCGICSAVCPYGLKLLKKRSGTKRIRQISGKEENYDQRRSESA